MKTAIRAGALALAPLALVIAAATPASAHAPFDVGQYHIEMGWGDEPTYAGMGNSVQVIITNSATKQALTDLGDTLRVEVSTGDQKMTVPLVPNFEVGGDGIQGDYRGWLIPTRPGTYTFHLMGTIAAQAVDKSITSSETTFDDVKDPGEIEFPVKDPSVGDLAQRFDKESSRATAASASAAHDAKKADDAAKRGEALGLVGVVLGAIALGTAFTKRGRSA